MVLTRTAAIVGPMTRATLAVVLFSVTASRTRSRPTTSWTNACRAGLPAALRVPNSSARTTTCHNQAEPRLGGEQHMSFGVAVDHQPGIRGQQQDRRVSRCGGQGPGRCRNASGAAPAAPGRPSPSRCRSGSATAPRRTGESSARPGPRTSPACPYPSGPGSRQHAMVRNGHVHSLVTGDR